MNLSELRETKQGDKIIFNDDSKLIDGKEYEVIETDVGRMVIESGVGIFLLDCDLYEKFEVKK